MGKTRKPTEKIVNKWIAQGYGQGEGATYLPFFHVRDVPSRGRSAIVGGLKTGRIHHYLSDLEYHHHILAEFSRDVIDIREQYALLPREETLEIARNLGIAHSIYPYTNTPLVMTSDIVLTRGNHELAVVSIKYSSDVVRVGRSQERTLEKLRIEQEYWKRRNVPWALSTEKNINVIQAKNLAMLRTTMVSRELDGVMLYIQEFVNIFQKKWNPHMNLHDLLVLIGELMNQPLDLMFCLFGRSVWLRHLPVNLDNPIDHFTPVHLI